MNKDVREMRNETRLDELSTDQLEQVAGGRTGLPALMCYADTKGRLNEVLQTLDRLRDSGMKEEKLYDYVIDQKVFGESFTSDFLKVFHD